MQGMFRGVQITSGHVAWGVIVCFGKCKDIIVAIPSIAHSKGTPPMHHLFIIFLTYMVPYIP
jgi:hypothetical protein